MRQCAKLSAHAFIVCYAVDLGGKAAEQRFVRHDLERNRAVAVPCAQQAGQCAERLLLRLTGTAEYAQTLAVFAQLEQTELPDDLGQERKAVFIRQQQIEMPQRSPRIKIGQTCQLVLS